MFSYYRMCSLTIKVTFRDIKVCLRVFACERVLQGACARACASGRMREGDVIA